MKTSFSVKVTGSFTVSIEPPLNEDGGGDGGDANDGGGILVDVLLKSLVNHAVKKYVHDEGITAEEEEEEDGDDDDDANGDLSSPLPQRRIPVDADDSVEDEEASVEEDNEQDDDEDQDEAGDLPNVRIEYDYADENNLSQKMTMMNLRRK
jgi:hypothetical protein